MMKNLRQKTALTPPRLTLLRGFAAACAMAASLAAPPAMAQTTIDLTLDEARTVATRALFSGQPALALQIARTILAQSPDDRAALLVVAAAAPQLGDPTAGRQAGARAWTLSQTPVEKYEAARLTALAAANEERFTLSTFWLRRALTVAPNDAERARTIQDARAVSRRNPWSTELSFSLVPSNNVNGGADDSDCTSIGSFGCTLSEDAVALQGWRASLSFGTQYRLQESQVSRTQVGLQYQLSRAWITEETTVPDEAFNAASYGINISHDRALKTGTISARLSRGRSEYRDLDLSAGTTEPEYYDILRFGIDRQFPLSDRTALSFSAGREWLEYSVSVIGKVDRAILSTGIGYQLNNRDRVSASLSFVDNEGENPNYTSQEQSISLSYAWAEPFGPVTLSVGGGFKWSDYPDYRIGFAVDSGRQDETVFASMNIGFPQIAYAGFTPGLRIDASKTNSNVSRFDRTTVSVGLTIKSLF